MPSKCSEKLSAKFTVKTVTTEVCISTIYALSK